MSTEDTLELTLLKRIDEARQNKAEADRDSERWGVEIETYETMLATYRARGDTAPRTDGRGARQPPRRVRYLRPVNSVNDAPRTVRYPRRGATGEAVLRLLAENPAGMGVQDLATALRQIGHLARSNDLAKSADWEVYNLIRNGWAITRRLGHYRIDLERCAQLGLHIP